MKNMLFTSESVLEGHPDKICDQISDAILDAIIEKDANCRVACETSITTGLISIIGEITADCQIDIPSIARSVVKEIGYTNKAFGFDADTCAIVTAIDKQSADIALGVDNSLENKQGSTNEADCYGAGDQGMMFGYACDDTEELMPLPISLAHKLAQKLSELRKSKIMPYLYPDGKTQITIQYDDENRPAYVDTVVVSVQHSDKIDIPTLRKDITEKAIIKVIPAELITSETKIYVNPTGRFVIGGPNGDSGLTGRKIIVDTYGGYSRHGGGAFSGKDPTKVDRSAAYMARYIAKNIVAAGLANRCEVQLAYAIGVSTPVSIMVDTFNTGIYSDLELSKAVKQVFDLRPQSIIKQLDLLKPIYRRLAVYGHMGREDLDVRWEKTDKIQELKRCFK